MEPRRQIILGDNARVLGTLPDAFARLLYIDPPFNTGKAQKRDRMKVRAASDGEGSRAGFGGKRYQVEKIASSTYADAFDDFEAFLVPRIEQSLRCLTPDASLFIHLDAREVHYIKVALDPDRYVFNVDAMDRIPYLAPELVTPEKAARGKTPTDV